MHEKKQPEELTDITKAILRFWMQGDEKIRNPFPDAMTETLHERSTQRILTWYDNLPETALRELSEEDLLERVEEQIFEEAYALAENDEQRITIKYPLMLRVEDKVRHEGHTDSRVVSRNIVLEQDSSFLEIHCVEINSGKSWSTTFELYE